MINIPFFLPFDTYAYSYSQRQAGKFENTYMYRMIREKNLMCTSMGCKVITNAPFTNVRSVLETLYSGEFLRTNN